MENQAKLVDIKHHSENNYLLKFNKDISHKGDVLQGMYPDLFNYKVISCIGPNRYFVEIIRLKENLNKTDLMLDLKEGNVFDSINNPIHD